MSETVEAARTSAAIDVARDLCGLLDLRGSWFEPWPFERQLPRLEPGRVVLPPDEPGSRSYGTWRPDDGIELPVRFGDLVLGRFVLVPAVHTVGVVLDPSARQRAIELAAAYGRVLAHQYLSEGAPRG